MSNADWWAKRLQNVEPQQQQARPTNLPPMPPSQLPMAPLPQFNPQQAERAQSAAQTSLCPGCGSNNYMAVSGAALRCFDCGYPIEQSGSRYGALTGAHVEGAAKSSRGNDVVSNWNPQGIIGRIN